MAENSGISWTDNTFNPWLGCVRVSPACEHCYAETLVTGRLQLPVWGPASTTARKRTVDTTWKKPRQWDRSAARAGRRIRVFCASLADVFETHPALPPWREELFEMIEQTPNLDWLLLTKRPQNICAMLPAAWLERPRPNVWLGTTVEDQRRADERVPHLLSAPAVVRFLSCEPLLGAIDLSPYLVDDLYRMGRAPVRSEIDWVIAGGESGADARPMFPGWPRALRDQCVAAGVPFHFKQWGEFAPSDVTVTPRVPRTIVHRDGRRWDGVEGVRAAALEIAMGNCEPMERVGKDRAGNKIDGRTWHEFPEVSCG